jgi:hypothetical protein
MSLRTDELASAPAMINTMLGLEMGEITLFSV